MRIMLIDHYAGSDRYGMEFRPYYMARKWLAMGHEPIIVAADFTHLRKINPKVANDFDEEIIDGVKYVWVKTPVYFGNNTGRGLNISTFVVKLRRHAHALAEKYRPEAVIASSTYPMDIYPAAKIAKASHAGLFFEIHDLWPLTPMQIGNLHRWNPIIMVMQAAENFAFRRSDRIISILPDTDKYIRKRGFDEGKFVYIPNGVIVGAKNAEDGRFISQIEQLHRLHADGWFLVGYTGNHSISNALENFIISTAHMRGEKVKVVLVGSGNYKTELQQNVALNHLKNVIFLDPVPKNCMSALLAQLDAAYMGLSKSGLFQYGVSPNKLFDYMLAKKPVIYAVEASNDPVSDCGCGITVPVGDSKKIAEAILQLKNMTENERKEMGQRGYEYVLQHHNYDTLSKRYIDTLEETVRVKNAVPEDYTTHMSDKSLNPYREHLAHRRVGLFFKRVWDIIAAAICATILIPVYIAAAIAVKTTSRGPVFFFQPRVGKNGKLFKIIKFRTMRVKTVNNNTLTVGNADPRITPVGNFLRVSRIDEFPQFFNVLKGDMSIIGVRPEIPHYLPYFKSEDYATLLMRPGMTSPASIRYRHENEMLLCDDPEKKYIEKILPEKMAVNREYIRNYSFWNDVKILGRTFKCIFEKDRYLEEMQAREKESGKNKGNK